jgi:fibronectin type 3 domain-containing protein
MRAVDSLSRRRSRCTGVFKPIITALEKRVLMAGSPIVITKGGTYSGSWESQDPNVPAVLVQTSEPVTIENSVVRGRGDLIAGAVDHVKITVRNTSGFGLNPNVAGRAPGRFVTIERFDSADLENNYLESTAGIYMLDYAGNHTINQTITVLDNRAKNIDGRKSNGSGGWLDYNARFPKKRGSGEEGMELVQFVQFDKVQNVPGINIAWNEVINEPGNSRVEDNISIYQSSGTAGSPILIHDNYIQGAYTIKPWQGDTSDSSYNYDWSYSGGGIMLGDGLGSTAGGDPAFVKAFNNQVISTTNYGIAITAGHDLEFYNNRIVSAGVLQDGRNISAQNVGAFIWDLYGGGSNRFYNVKGHDNTIGWVQGAGRNDIWEAQPGTMPNNVSMPNPITLQTEAAEYVLWQQKLGQHRQPPAAPQNLVASAVGSSRVDVSWSDVSGETGYRVERSGNGVDGWSVIASVGAGALAYSDRGLSAQTTYFYRVIATNYAGDSGYSDVASATTAAETIPLAPANLTATASGGSRVNLVWSDRSDNENGFVIERSSDAGASWTPLTTLATDATSSSDTTVVPGTSYRYRVKATGNAGDSEYSNTATVTTPLPPPPPPALPAAPTGLSLSVLSSSSIRLSWLDNSSNESGFIIQRSTDGSRWTQIATVNANSTSYTSTGLQRRTRYYYRVVAVNSAGNSPYSNVASATTFNR